MLIQRRQFLQMTSTLPWSGTAAAAGMQGNIPREDLDRIPISLCLNAYSFNSLLRNGEMSLERLFRFAKDTGFQGVDLTAYYIPGYPDVPTDEVLYNIKLMAFRLGLALTGTGVRNNFTLADPEQRKPWRRPAAGGYRPPGCVRCAGPPGSRGSPPSAR